VDFSVELSEYVSGQITASLHAAQAELAAQKLRWEQAKAERAARKAEEAAKAAEAQLATDPMLTENTVCADPSDTELLSEDGKEILTGGVFEITYYNQGDDTWASQPYGSDQIGPYGCGPTALAMAVSSMTGEDADPAVIAKLSVSCGCWAAHSGSYSSIVSKVAESYGLTVESISQQTPEALCDALLSGKVIVALMGPGHFTKSGHYILLRGVTLSGQILVADPNSRDRSLMVWDPQLILDELSHTTSNGAPLWTLSLDA
jgi:hypothetical protein